MTYNGYSDFDKFFVINHIELPFGSFKAITKEYEGIDGERFFGVSRGSYELKLEITLMSDNENEEMSIDMIRREVLRRISTRSEQELKFSTLPNVKFKAVPDGENSLTLINPKTGKAEITFKVPEGYSKETILTTATAKLNEAGVLSMEIDYDGTVDTPLNLKIVNNDETGYLSAIGVNNGEQTFLTQLGYVDEVDKVAPGKSATITNKNTNDWIDGTINLQDSDKSVVTKMTLDSNGYFGKLPQSFTNTTGKRYYGALKEFVFPNVSANCYLLAKGLFETGNVNQTGSWGISLINELNQHTASMIIEKTNTTNNIATIFFIVGNRIKHSIDFVPYKWSDKNPYGSDALAENRNMFDLAKDGDTVTFYFYGVKYPFRVDTDQIPIGIKKSQFYIGQFNGKPSSQIVSKMGIKDITVVLNDVPHWTDVPNRFRANTVVEIRKTDGMNKIYRDGIATLEDLITGSTFPMLKPGKNTIEFYYSGFTTTPPTVTATYEKRWY